MFILRVITPEGIQENISLGEKFRQYRRARETSEYIESIKILSQSFSAIKSGLRPYIIIEDQNGILIPVWRQNANYIMTGEGKTFSNITHRQIKNQS